MASSFSNTPILPVKSYGSRTRKRMIIGRVQAKHVSPMRIHTFKTSLITKTKIFEDCERGIVCYRDENGEVISEGLDEGPRYQPPATQRFSEKRKEVQILELIRKSHIQLIEGVDYLCIGKTIPPKGNQDSNAAKNPY